MSARIRIRTRQAILGTISRIELWIKLWTERAQMLFNREKLLNALLSGADPLQHSRDGSVAARECLDSN